MNAKWPQAAAKSRKTSSISFVANLCVLSCQLVRHAGVLAVGWCKSWSLRVSATRRGWCCSRLLGNVPLPSTAIEAGQSWGLGFFFLIPVPLHWPKIKAARSGLLSLIWRHLSVRQFPALQKTKQEAEEWRPIRQSVGYLLATCYTPHSLLLLLRDQDDPAVSGFFSHPVLFFSSIFFF